MSIQQTKFEDSNIVLAETLLTAISEIMSSVGTMDTAETNLLELGCYLYRATPAILELQRSSNIPPNVTEILQSLSSNIDLAGELVRKYSKGEKSMLHNEPKNIAQELKEVIGNIGDDLSLIPSSTFENQRYAEIAVRSLSREMKRATFHVSEGQLNVVVETKTDNTTIQEGGGGGESIPIPDSVEEHKRHSDDRNGTPPLREFLKGMYYGVHGNNSYSLKTLQLAENIEPLYDTFFCPLTKKIMEDPVTIESGITYERRAITEWFDRFKDDTEVITCPTTGMEIKNKSLNTNIALKTTIEEWKERNEATRIGVARTALTLAQSDAMVLDAIRDLTLLCRKRRCNNVKIHNVGITKLLTTFLEYKDTKLRCETLEILCLLAEDEEGKEIIGKTKAIPTAIKMLSSIHLSVRHASVSFLLELSKSELLCENIGSVTGGILMLITMKYNEYSDPSASDKAGEILKNLESCKKNMKGMAENGHLEPLLNHLINGSEEIQREMVSYLSQLIIGNDMKTYVADRASKSLIKMICRGDIQTRKAAFKSLAHISSHHPNNKTLVSAGVVSVIIKELFMKIIHDKPMDSREESAAILANILESGIAPSSLQVNKHGHTIASDYFINNIIHMLKCPTSDELNLNLIKILLSLTKSEQPFSTILSMIKEEETSLKIIDFLNSSHEDLITASAELLITVSSHTGHTIAEGLCKTGGQPEGLINHLETDRITKKHAMTTNLLAKLPHQNLTLNLCLHHRATVVPSVLQRIHQIQRGGARASKYTRDYLEGLVGILVRFTGTLYDQDILQMAREQNLVSVFTDLLISTSGSYEVQRLSAIGLERLSSESINLSKRIVQRRRSRTRFFRCLSLGERNKRKIRLCPVHRGECSESTNFCLLEARAVERLLGCLEHQNDKVVEAALAAISTLLDERVDVAGGFEVLNEMKAVQQVLKLLREHQSEGVWNKSLWVIERFLVGGGERSASDISTNKELPFALVTALNQGDSSTRKVAENILRKMNKVPQFSSTSSLIL